MVHSLLAFGVLAISQASAAPLRVTVVDQTGAPFPDVLLIVRALDGSGELFRALTDLTGRIPERDPAPGLYRIIATCPYGICETRISEFLVGRAPVALQLKVDVSPTKGNGLRIGPSLRTRVEVIDAAGKPTPSARVLVRDSTAENERWYDTAADGSADVELPEGPVTFAALHGDILAEMTYTSAQVAALSAEGRTLRLQLKQCGVDVP